LHPGLEKGEAVFHQLTQYTMP